MEEALIGVDVAHAGEQALVEQCGLDGQMAGLEELSEFLASDGERVNAGGAESGNAGKVEKIEAAKPARVHKAQLAPTGKAQTGVGVRCQRLAGSGDQQAARHAQMHDPLSGRLSFHGAIGRPEFADNMLSGAMDSEDCAPCKAFGLASWRAFEGLAMAAEDGLDNAVAAHPLMNSAGNGLDLWQLGHWVIVREQVGRFITLQKALCVNPINLPR